MEQRFRYPNEVAHHLFEERKVQEIVNILSDPHWLVAPEDEHLLFEPEFRPALMEYLKHHSIYEARQHLLLKSENEEVLDFFIQHWVLGSQFEQQLCTPEYRQKWLLKYLQFHNFADSDNELMLFEPDMDVYRRFYIGQTEFHSRMAEKRLFEPEFADDLRLYIENKRTLFNENVELLIAASPDLADLYRLYKKG
ncbi:MAG: hypothetical protein J6Y91_00905 [Alphaproteobacteria bacterium]|nr:hypothetical protein [Alphaproteobacteria bacterium]